MARQYHLLEVEMGAFYEPQYKMMSFLIYSFFWCVGYKEISICVWTENEEQFKDTGGAWTAKLLNTLSPLFHCQASSTSDTEWRGPNKVSYVFPPNIQQSTITDIAIVSDYTSNCQRLHYITFLIIL